MLINKFNFQIASYDKLENIDMSEIKKADMVQVNEFVPNGGIYHSKEMNWKGDITNVIEPIDFIRSKRERKNYFSAIDFLSKNNILTFVNKIKDMQDATEFFSLYEETTMKKNRSIDYQSRLILEKNLSVGLNVYLIGAYKNNHLEAGLICTMYRDEIMVAFGAKKKIPELRGGLGGVLEIELIKLCKKLNINLIAHGMSENPTGISGSSGIFEFKSRYGFSAFPIGHWLTTFLINKNPVLSDLVFIGVENNHLCQVLIGESETEINKYKTTKVPFVIFKHIDQHILESRKFLKLETT